MLQHEAMVSHMLWPRTILYLMCAMLLCHADKVDSERTENGSLDGQSHLCPVSV